MQKKEELREMKGRDIQNESNENCNAETKERLQSEVEWERL